MEEELEKLARAVVEAQVERALVVRAWEQVRGTDAAPAHRRRAFLLRTAAVTKHEAARKALWEAAGWDTDTVNNLIKSARSQYGAEAEQADVEMLEWDEHPVKGVTNGD